MAPSFPPSGLRPLEVVQNARSPPPPQSVSRDRFWRCELEQASGTQFEAKEWRRRHSQHLFSYALFPPPSSPLFLQVKSNSCPLAALIWSHELLRARRVATTRDGRPCLRSRRRVHNLDKGWAARGRRRPFSVVCTMACIKNNSLLGKVFMELIFPPVSSEPAAQKPQHRNIQGSSWYRRSNGGFLAVRNSPSSLPFLHPGSWSGGSHVV